MKYPCGKVQAYPCRIVQFKRRKKKRRKKKRRKKKRKNPCRIVQGSLQ